MAPKEKHILLSLFLLFSLVFLLVLVSGDAYPYPGSGVENGSAYEGWTGEVTLGFQPRHVQAAASQGRLYLVWDDGGDVYFSCSDDQGITFSFPLRLDYNPSRPACDAYLAASGSHVAVSFKELGSTWAQVVAFSPDRGVTWSKFIDENAGWSSYEAHLVIEGGKVHGAYVSNWPGRGARNEVYYRRWDLSGALERTVCASVYGDGIAACYPCVEVNPNSPSNIGIYYQHGNSAPHPLWESWSTDGGVNWNRIELLPVNFGNLNLDISYPECTRFMEDKHRVAVVANGLHLGNNAHAIFYLMWDGVNWTVKDRIKLGNLNYSIYPQIAARGGDLFIAFRGCGEDFRPAGGRGMFNGGYGRGDAWAVVWDLFYANEPFPNAGSIDVCSDGNRFYAASAGTGGFPKVLVKREDRRNPSVVITQPSISPSFHHADFTVSATATDDFNYSADSLLSPNPEHYDRGILHADFFYRPAGSGNWLDFPGGRRANDAPFEKVFDVDAIADGTYEVKVEVRDTAERTSSHTLSGIVVDRTPPVASCGLSGGMEGDNGWYKAPPNIEGSFNDSLSGVEIREYRIDQGSWQSYSSSLVAREGVHTYSFRCRDRAGNWSRESTVEAKVDTVAPTVTAVVPPADGLDGWRVSDPAATVTLKADDNSGGSGEGVIRYSWDGAPGIDYVDPVVAPEGIHTLYFQARDLAGNWSGISSLELRKDLTPPSVEIIEPTGEHWIRGMVTVKADATDNCVVKAVEFYMDSERFDHRESYPFMGSLDTTRWTNDYHTIEAIAIDAAGNRSQRGGGAQVVIFVGNNISETNCFAEGCTRPGFETWLCLQNPGDEPASVTVNYMLGPGQGTAAPRIYTVPSHSRMTIFVNNDVGAGKDVSIQVTSSRPIVSERPIYFNYKPGLLNWQGCHTAQGISLPRPEWYLAEGCTRPGFEEYLCIQNPGDEPASVRVDYMLEDSRVITRRYPVDRWQRFTVCVNAEVGSGHDVSAHLSSPVPIVVERPMYFLYQGMWDGGHNVMGAVQPETTWFFAEGCTRSGFNQWLCIQNPGAQDAKVTVNYMTEDGGQITKEYGVLAHSRFTINVNNDVARQHDVSTRITSDQPIVVERPMYFNYGMAIDEGSDAMGVNKPSSTWYLAEGCTRKGFEEWICLQNPGEKDAVVLLRFMLEDCTVHERRVSVPAGFRVTVKVNDLVPGEHDVSTVVMSDQPIVVERPIYARYRGSMEAADTLAGYTFNP